MIRCLLEYLAFNVQHPPKALECMEGRFSDSNLCLEIFVLVRGSPGNKLRTHKAFAFTCESVFFFVRGGFLVVVESGRVQSSVKQLSTRNRSRGDSMEESRAGVLW